ncbi:cell division suppressor protein YneA [Aureibacillus halotolerans]|uniref:LysM domain-containing protein n=1 Tax=Aureibacillus halotolerans TaxID=1508390 RepID=A0A4R6U0B7_9BACI|nr:LysM peptidoglycan-binding domain-containing protein [Aureibacillus halotolerans]TDQ39738.1 LysM domain-containing protein [Aureibacillus halotolerans]
MVVSGRSYYICLAFVIVGLILFHGVSDEEYATVHIEKGDSIWALAEEYTALHTMSKPDFIQWVKENNQLPTSTLEPGQQLIIPVTMKQLSTERSSQFAYTGAE